MTHIAFTRGPTSCATRWRISFAALFVKVMARISPGAAWSVSTRYAIRCVRTRVLPLPAPASTRSGPRSCRTASRWGSFRPSRRRDCAVVVATDRVWGRGRASEVLGEEVHQEAVVPGAVAAALVVPETPDRPEADLLVRSDRALVLG